MSAWMPIETAPKDGAEVWLGATAEEPSRRRVAPGFWGGRAWIGSHSDEPLFWQPTHWQPYIIPMAPEPDSST